MKVNEAAWDNLKNQIEAQTEDSNVTDILIHYQITESKNKNFLKFNIK